VTEEAPEYNEERTMKTHDPEVLPPADDFEDDTPTLSVVQRETAVVSTEAVASPLATMSDAEFDVLVAQQARVRQRIIRVQREAMQEGIDYGKVPGTKNNTLFKPGAEVLTKMMGAVAEYDQQRILSEVNGITHLTYVFTCRIVKDGKLVGQGSGSCSTLETKYRYRYSSKKCPECGFDLTWSKKDGNFFCWQKKGGCGKQFPESQIPRTTTKEENPDVLGLDNTILKMSKKRAKVDAALDATAASGTFTQDYGDDEGLPPAPPAPPTPPEPKGEEPPPPGDDAAPPATAAPDPTVDELRAFMKDAVGVKTVNEAHDALLKAGIKVSKTNSDEHGRIRIDKITPKQRGAAMKALRETKP
jgi:hypothetical protein